MASVRCVRAVSRIADRLQAPAPGELDFVDVPFETLVLLLRSGGRDGVNGIGYGSMSRDPPDGSNVRQRYVEWMRRGPERYLLEQIPSDMHSVVNPLTGAMAFDDRLEELRRQLWAMLQSAAVRPAALEYGELHGFELPVFEALFDTSSLPDFHFPTCFIRSDGSAYQFGAVNLLRQQAGANRPAALTDPFYRSQWSGSRRMDIFKIGGIIYPSTFRVDRSGAQPALQPATIMPSFALQPGSQFVVDAPAAPPPDRRSLFARRHPAASDNSPDRSPRPRSVPDTRPEQTTRGLPRSVQSASLEGVSRALWALEQGRGRLKDNETWGGTAARRTAFMDQVKRDLKSYRLPVIGPSVGFSPR